MLIIRCAACRRKLWRYDKIGPGEVLRCHKGRIDKFFCDLPSDGHKFFCLCGKEIGIDKGSFFKMVARAFIYSGTKRNG